MSRPERLLCRQRIHSYAFHVLCFVCLPAGPSSLGHSSETSHRESVPIPSAQSSKQASGPAPASSSAFRFLGGGGGGIGLVPAKTAGGDSGHAGAPYSSAPHAAPSSAPGDGDGSGTPMSVGASDVNRPGHASPPSRADAFRPSTSFDSAGRVEDNLGELMGLGPDLSWQPSPSVSVPVPPSDRPTVPTGMGGRSGSAGVGHSLVPSGPVKKTRRAHLPQFAAAAAAPPPSTTGGLPPSPSLPESGVTRPLSGPTGDGHAEVEVSAHAPPSVVSSPAASLSASQARPKPPPPPTPPPLIVPSPSTLESPHPEGECAPVSEPNSVAALPSEDGTESSGVMRKFLASSSSASPSPKTLLAGPQVPPTDSSPSSTKEEEGSAFSSTSTGENRTKLSAAD
uniref:Uncharacterized protein n=1 Tax=Chromera velia CCMP2878 TaxID=1169474 RepID=A0A0G4GZR1_9ALVE|eukprot:Cvel_24074.t1-p1 / transcript=Cvel_24074.t1 / gene=Cvel_24074 / organism=Chromera_velia_CCMP2878 / gene_product=hypothetical protein / transcript_product=hypothetical protein / location=Cvel_scaffold2562:23061-24603(+) / protein_length=395 / sequence_SO=supercontig / SO=protein_coding / is_pseudo=false